MGQGDESGRPYSRRAFLKGAAATGAALATGTAIGAGPAGAADGAAKPSKPKGPKRLPDAVFVNGKILTLDGSNTVGSAFTIRDGRFEAVGGPRVGPAAERVDLGGATVIPGLIDSHVHFIRNGTNPGHEVRIIETATSIEELLQMIADRAQTVPSGEFITCVGGWNRNGLAERRLPTPAELDASAPQNPVYLSETGGGRQGVTNTAGAAFFTTYGVGVDSDGIVASTGAAFNALAAAQSDDDRQQGTREAIAFANSLGLTMVHDMGGLVGLDSYKYTLNLWRQRALNMRIRFFFWSGEDPGISEMEARISNNLNQLGDSYYRPVGVGERINTSTTNPLFVDACTFAAEHGWTLTQHSNTANEIAFHISAYQQAATVAPIDALRWSLCHVQAISDAQIAQVQALGIGLNIQGTSFTGTPASPPNAGPPFRKLLDAGIPCGGGTDATNVAALNPWLMMSYMTTGKNNGNAQTNDPAQSISRLEALKLYTSGSSYLSFDDDELGTIEPGKLADFVVLSDDPLQVSDEKLRKIQANLTVVGGQIAHQSGRFAKLTL